MQDKPMQIIEETRLKSQLESLGRPYINAVQIKVLQTEIDGANDQETEGFAEKLFYTTTFRVSKLTDFIILKKEACDFWGLNHKNYSFYDESAELIDGQDPLPMAQHDKHASPTVQTVEKHFEAFMGGKGKDSPKIAILYLS